MPENIKVIAYYLPQFHAIPENDKAWGEGFTEWTNVRRAVPLFKGHYQPRIPLNGNYYCLLDSGVMESQAAMAKKYGIYGFCYYHYWFKDGKKLLEKPLENMLNNPKVDIPFCLCWANENWTRRWDGGNNEVIIEQDYEDMKNLERHVDYLCRFFADPRYIKEDGRPFFIIYKPDLIPNIHERIKYIRERVISNGFPGIIIAAQHPSYFREGKCIDFSIDRYIQFEPLFYKRLISGKNNIKDTSLKGRIKRILESIGILRPLQIIKRTLTKTNTSTPQHYSIDDYDRIWKNILAFHPDDKRFIAGAFKDWDNTPRKKDGSVVTGGTPRKFGGYMRRLVQKVRDEYSYPYIFIDAWNEWGEGAYLEPDERYGYEWLEALRDALNS